MNFFKDLAKEFAIAGLELSQQSKRNELNSAPGTYGYTGQYYDEQYAQENGEFPHVKKIRDSEKRYEKKKIDIEEMFK